MSSDIHTSHEWGDRHRTDLRTRHTYEDALSERDYERLLAGCANLPQPRAFESRFICLLAGRLGLRAGEITHFVTQWIDWDRKLIRIPQYESCTCGYCHRQARQESQRSESLRFEEALADRWHPKTVNSARVVPFDVSLRVELCIEQFAEQYDRFPHSRSTVNRRVSEARHSAGLSGRIYPHCLRATAASFHAYRGVAPVPLQGLMGWSDLSTAQKYIRVSGTATAKAVRRVHQ